MDIIIPGSVFTFFYLCMCMPCVVGSHGCQEGIPDPSGIVGDSEQHGWDLNSGPVEEKQALLAAGPSQPN